MPIPDNILAVPRPKNTVVVDRGGNGCRRFAVRKRKCTKHLSGKNPAPVNGETIGYIIDNRFVQKVEAIAKNGPSFCSYGASAFIKSVSDDILLDLYKYYPISDARSILAIAMLRVLKPHIASNRYTTIYKQTYISQYYPNLYLSKNYISSLQEKIGMDTDKRYDFFQARLSSVCKEHHIIIDGMLKQDNSRVNYFSDFSYKSRLKNVKDISIIYAYDLENKEPICGEVFQGNSVDALSYSAFIRDNKITKGIIVADKGFPVTCITDELRNNNDLHYISPLKRNDKRILDNNMYDYDDRFEFNGKDILCKKVLLEDNKILYSFLDSTKEYKEKIDYLKRTRTNEQFDHEKFKKHNNRFGTFVLLSDLNIDPYTIYLCYSERWIIELIFDRYKNDLELTCTEVQNNYSVIGSEFINFIASIITCRLLNKLEELELLKETTFGNLMDDLSQIRRKTIAPIDILPEYNDKFWEQNPIKEQLNIMVKLGLVKALPINTPVKRGRPPKEDIKTQKKSTRGPGRPRKHPKPDPNIPKRPVGRPRTRPLPDATVPKRPVGRPRKYPKPDSYPPVSSKGEEPKKSAEKTSI